METKPPSCPCCQFLPEDMFLPSSPAEESIEDSDYVATNNTDNMLTPIEAWKALLQQKKNHTNPRGVLLVDTHGHAHLDRGGNDGEEVDDSTSDRNIYRLNSDGDNRDGSTTTDNNVASLTCAVSPDDWESCLDYASKSSRRVAAIGVHPWYLDNLKDHWLDELEALVNEHPGCMVGEMGLCKQARFLRTYEGGKKAAMELQRSVFTDQLGLAAQYRRGVSIHCVNQQGILLEILKERCGRDELLPPVIALHSFTGTAHHVKQLLQWEASLKLPPLQLPLLYFGFSHTVNYAMCSSEKSRRQGRLAVQTVPRERLLAESDVHCDADVTGGTAGAVAYIAWALGEEKDNIGTVADLTRWNGIEFLKRAHV